LHRLEPRVYKAATILTTTTTIATTIAHGRQMLAINLLSARADLWHYRTSAESVLLSRPEYICLQVHTCIYTENKTSKLLKYCSLTIRPFQNNINFTIQ